MMPLGLFITGEGNMLAGSGSTSLFWAICTSTAFTGFYYISKKIMNLKEFMDYMYKGIGGMAPVSMILIFAFAIGHSITTLGTGQYLASLLNGASIDPAFTGVIVFILAGLMAFATGTSWGTFAIMIPIALQTAVALDGNIYLAVGAAISGGIMGDHCSPISDTTIMASMATASDHIHHVRTQIPYVLVNAAISSIIFIVLGFI
jgi:Na+/H+ antiporter NhaC